MRVAHTHTHVRQWATIIVVVTALTAAGLIQLTARQDAVVVTAQQPPSSPPWTGAPPSRGPDPGTPTPSLPDHAKAVGEQIAQVRRSFGGSPPAPMFVTFPVSSPLSGEVIANGKLSAASPLPFVGVADLITTVEVAFTVDGVSGSLTQDAKTWSGPNVLRQIDESAALWASRSGGSGKADRSSLTLVAIVLRADAVEDLPDRGKALQAASVSGKTAVGLSPDSMLASMQPPAAPTPGESPGPSTSTTQPRSPIGGGGN